MREQQMKDPNTPDPSPRLPTSPIRAIQFQPKKMMKVTQTNHFLNPISGFYLVSRVPWTPVLHATKNFSACRVQGLPRNALLRISLHQSTPQAMFDCQEKCKLN